MQNKQIYLKAEKHIQVKNDRVYLGDVFKVLSDNPSLDEKLKRVLIYDFRKNNTDKLKSKDCDRAVISILMVIDKLQKAENDIEVISLGENDIILEKQTKPEPGKAIKVIKITFVSLVCFFGSAFTIMAFHNDINVIGLFEKIYDLVGLEYRGGVGALELGYSIGLGAGIVIFYNHIGKRRITKDPTPLEVEMRVYEDEVDQTLIDNAGREGLELDV